MIQSFKLQISAAADRHLDAIYEYGFLQWGEVQADRYYDGLIAHFAQLCDNPFLYSSVDHIRPGYRRSVYESHSVYYRVTADMVEVMAIIGRENLDTKL